MGRRSHLVAFAVTTVAAAIGAAACGGGSSGGSAGNAPAATAAATATTSAATSGAATSGVTKAGTALTVGQSATVPYVPLGSTTSDATLKLKVTVDSIEKGSLSDFNGIQLDAAQRAGTPEYVKVHITNLGPAPVKGSEASVAIEGVDNTGQTQQSLTFIGDFPKCTENESQAQLGRGDTFQTCLTFLVPGGITKAAYVNGTDYIESPVTWAAG